LASKVRNEVVDDWQEAFDEEETQQAPAPVVAQEDEPDEKEPSGPDGFTEDSVRLYLREIGRVKMIKPDEDRAGQTHCQR